MPSHAVGSQVPSLRFHFVCLLIPMDFVDICIFFSWLVSEE